MASRRERSPPPPSAAAGRYSKRGKQQQQRWDDNKTAADSKQSRQESSHQSHTDKLCINHTSDSAVHARGRDNSMDMSSYTCRRGESGQAASGTAEDKRVSSGGITGSAETQHRVARKYAPDLADSKSALINSDLGNEPGRELLELREPLRAKDFARGRRNRARQFAVLAAARYESQ